jgi:UDP-N-acetyl-2-amino-2-deoxyglucuronate dehydrogenase
MMRCNHVKTLGFGIVGCGVAAKWHQAALARIAEAQLIAVCDQQRDRAESMGRAADVAWTVDLEEFLNHPGLDVVCICTPSGTHYSVGLLALESGAHVVVEKPLALTVQDADHLIAVAEKQGRIISTISQLRFSDAAQAAKKILGEGSLGRILMADLYMKFYRSPEYYRTGGWRGTWQFDGGGALMNQGIHGVDLLLWLVGSVAQVVGKTYTLYHEIEVEDVAYGLLEYTNGAVGILQASTCCNPGVPRTIEIHGEGGTLVLRDDRLELIDPKGTVSVVADTDKASGVASDPTALKADGHLLQLTDVVSAIQRGTQPLIDGRQGRNAVELVTAVYRSAQEGKPVVFSK